MRTRRVSLARFHARMQNRATSKAFNQWSDKAIKRAWARATIARLALSASRSYKQWALSKWAKTSANSVDRDRHCRQLVLRFEKKQLFVAWASWRHEVEKAREFDALRRRCLLRLRHERLWRAFSVWDKRCLGARAGRARDARVSAFCARRRRARLHALWQAWRRVVSEKLRHERLVARALNRMHKRRMGVSFELLDAFRRRRQEARRKVKRLVVGKMRSLEKLGFDAMRENCARGAAQSAQMRLAALHLSRRTTVVTFRHWARHCQRFKRARELRRQILERLAGNLLYCSFAAWGGLCRERRERRAQSNRAANVIARMV